MSAPPTPSTLLRITGRDALAVLHRLATQQLEDLAPGQARMTCFCDFRGRLLHRACVAVDPDHSVWLICDDAPGDELVTFVDRHVFREDLKIENRSAEAHVRLDLAPSRDAAARARHESTTTWTGARTSEWTVPVPGGRFAVGPAVSRTNEVARIRAGWPRNGQEIAESFTPFEIGLAHEVHLSKGCFTGQEALMRLVTYRSVRRRLVRVHGRGGPPGIPADVVRAGATVGRLTSAIAEGNAWIGLAVVQHGAIDATDLVVAGAPIDTVDPFPATQPLGLELEKE